MTGKCEKLGKSENEEQRLKTLCLLFRGITTSEEQHNADSDPI